MRKKLMLFYVGSGILCFLCLVFSGILIYSSLEELGVGTLVDQPDTDPVTDVNILYRESKNPTELQKEYYNELIEVSKNYPEEFDPYEVSKKVVKCFVSDFYTWTNKDGNYDVGGLDFLYGPHHLTFALYARDTYYQNFNHFEKEYGVENLAEVSSVTITNEAFAGHISVNGEDVPAYYFEAEWTYKEGSLMDTSKLQYRASFTVFENKESGRFEIARIYNIE